MSMVKCPECGKDVSDKAEKCLNCGFGVAEYFSRIEKENQERVEQEESEHRRLEEIERRMESIKVPKKNKGAWMFAVCLYIFLGVLIFSVALISQPNAKPAEVIQVFLMCIAAFVVFPVFLYKRESKKHEKIQADVEKYKREQAEKQIKLEEIRKRNQEISQSRKLKCVACGSENISVSFQITGEKSNIRTEVRKKNVIERVGNKAGRAGMIMATGGLWAVTPKKSDFKEVQKANTKTTQVKIAICQDCGHSWNL